MQINRLSGIIPVDKPAGLTSHDVVDVVRRIAGQRQVGHTGTLDPLATGLMLVCLGKATKVAAYISGCDKRYEALVELGRTSPTYDAEGIDDSTPAGPVPELDMETLEQHLGSFRGGIEQQVPPHAAVRIDGERLYNLTRSGAEVELPRRKVHVHELTLQGRSDNRLTLDVRCSSGTYIRSLAHDIGTSLGCGAYLASLRRTEVGQMSLKDATTLESLKTVGSAEDLASLLLPIDRVLNWSAMRLTEQFVPLVAHGRPPGPGDVVGVDGRFQAGDKVFLKNTEGHVLALVSSEIDSESLKTSDRMTVCTLDRVLV